MPLRFRKVIKIAPGIKINLSKSGFSTSIGKRGASINLGKRGTRVTTGIPGSGISFSQLFGSKKSKFAAVEQTHQINAGPPAYKSPVKATTKKLPLSVLITTGIVAMLCPVFFFVATVTTPSATVTPTTDLVSVQNTAVAEAWISYTQTMLAMPTSTVLPTETLAPLPTQTLIPLPTATLTPWPTLTATAVIIIFPTQPLPVQSSCSCSGDSLNCGDFGSQSSAQACYNSCVAAGMGDIHNLDGDGNGAACESLP